MNQIRSEKSKICKVKEPPCFPKDSILWVFCERLLDAASSKSKYLSHDTPFVPFLRGIWSDFKYLIKNVCVKEGLFLPGLECNDVSDQAWKIDYRYCLMQQKLVLLNICIHHSLQNNDKVINYANIWDHPFVKGSDEVDAQSPLDKTIDISKKLIRVFTGI